MSQPKVTITELDGALGILPTTGQVFALVGPASQGPTDSPATFARVKDIVSTFGSGPLVEAAAYFVKNFGRPVVLVRTAASTAGSYGSLDVSGYTGDAVPTTDAASEPVDDFEARIEFVSGGTVGTAGITYRWSLDGGRTLSPITALGTANSITIPGSNVKIDFAAGDVEDGDVLEVRTEAPLWSAVELAAALDALAASAVAWELLHVVGPLDSAAIGAIDAAFGSLRSSGKYRAWIGNTRMPDEGESEADYLTAMQTDFGGDATTYGELCSGAAKVTSGVSGRRYRRPVAFTVAAREASVSEEVNIADVNLGALPGVGIRDSNGNPDEHDESVNPGLDDARFTVLRTWEGIAGVYVNRPRIFSAAGSDFELMPHRRVLNLTQAALRTFFLRRLNRPVRVDKTTGFILEEEAQEIETRALSVMRSALLAAPKASGVQFSLSRTDNLLSTKTMTGEARVIPLAYPEFINLDVGFLNPALQVVAV